MVDIEQLDMELKSELEKLRQEQATEVAGHKGAILSFGGDNTSYHQETPENIAFIKSVCELETNQQALDIIREIRERDLNRYGTENI